MLKAKQSPEKIEAIKNNIIEEALNIIKYKGLDELSMRKLALRLGIAAKTIYNYYQNKDEIYINILIKGFTALTHQIQSAINTNQTSKEQLRDIIRAYIDFGLNSSDLYYLMFTIRVPKYNDYVGSPLEQVAKTQLETALRVSELFSSVIQQNAGIDNLLSEDALKIFVASLWSQMHGYVVGSNNTLLNYIVTNPVMMKESVVERIVKNICREIQDYLVDFKN